MLSSSGKQNHHPIVSTLGQQQLFNITLQQDIKSSPPWTLNSVQYIWRNLTPQLRSWRGGEKGVPTGTSLGRGPKKVRLGIPCLLSLNFQISIHKIYISNKHHLHQMHFQWYVALEIKEGSINQHQVLRIIVSGYILTHVSNLIYHHNPSILFNSKCPSYWRSVLLPYGQHKAIFLLF